MVLLGDAVLGGRGGAFHGLHSTDDLFSNGGGILENLGKLFEDLVDLRIDFATITGLLSFVLHRSSTNSTHLLSTTSKSSMCKLIPETEPTIHRVRYNWRQGEELQPKGGKNEFIDIIW